MKVLLASNLHADIEELIENLKANQLWLQDLSVDDLIDFFNALSSHIESLDKRKFGATLKNLSLSLKKDYLKKIINLSLHGNYQALTSFVDSPIDQRKLTAFPKGLAVHWIAGNVPTLGFYSLVQGILTKNVNIIKASSKDYETFLQLVNLISEVNTEKIAGSDLINTIAVVLIERDEKDILKKLSINADVRIAWGGQEAIETISSLPKKLGSEDIFLGPKYSFAVVANDIKKTKIEKYAQRLALDVSVFDQYACSSPHVVFVEEGTDFTSLEFSQVLAKQMDLVTRTFLPKSEVDAGKVMEILAVRSDYLMRGQVIGSKNTDWTVIHTNEFGFEDACFSRVIYVKSVNNLERISQLPYQRVQTIGLACEDSDRRQKLARMLTKNGGSRVTNFGNMTYYENPWDGMFPIDRMVRWVLLEDSISSI